MNEIQLFAWDSVIVLAGVTVTHEQSSLMRLSPLAAKYNDISDKSVRDKAIEDVPALVRSLSKPFDAIELLQLWRALFYCFWMSDKAPVQHALADKLSNLIHELSNKADAFMFLRGFFDTMVKEWGGIDHLRMDKYLMLVRKVVRQYLEYCKCKAVCEEDMDELLDAWHVMTMPPNGLRFHIIDVFCDELFAVYPEVSTEALQVLVMPFYQILVSSDDSRLFSKVIGGVVKRILNALIPSEDGGAPQLPNVDMRPLLKDMFLIAASPDTQGSHRKPLHAVKAKYEPICLELFGDEDGEDESSCEGSGEENGEESEEGSEESEDETTNQPPENTDWLILNPEDSADEAADRLDEAEEDSDDSEGEDVSEEEEDDSEEEVVTFHLKPSRQSASSQITPKKAVSPAKSPVKPVTPAQSSEAAPQVVVTPKQASGSKKRATPPAGDASKAFTTPKKRVMIAVQSSTAIDYPTSVSRLRSQKAPFTPDVKPQKGLLKKRSPKE